MTIHLVKIKRFGRCNSEKTPVLIVTSPIFSNQWNLGDFDPEMKNEF
jgi:hypothetical protein